MNSQAGTVRLAVIDDDSGFLRVLTRRFDAAGWEYRLHSSSVPPEELVAMKLNAVLVDPLGPRPARLGVPGARLRDAPRPRRRRLHAGLDRGPAGARAAPGSRRLDRKAVAPRGGDGEDRGRRPPPPAQPAEGRRRAPRRGRDRDPRRPVPSVRLGSHPRAHPARVRAAAGARRGQRPGDRARGDLPAGLGLRDGPRRPLGGRVRAQAALEASEALSRGGATSTPTSGSAIGSSPIRARPTRPSCRPPRPIRSPRPKRPTTHR